MAKKAPQPGGSKSLVIVESPAKARTISKFLGKDYDVQASIGHVRDLPKGTREIPEKYKGEDWAYLGVNVNDAFTPVYIVPSDKKQQVAKLRKAIKGAKDLYLATDEDREGEAISWHLLELLKPKVPVHRLVLGATAVGDTAGQLLHLRHHFGQSIGRHGFRPTAGVSRKRRAATKVIGTAPHPHPAGDSIRFLDG